MLTTDSLGTYLQRYPIAAEAVDGSTDLPVDIDLRYKAFSGFMTLKIETTVKGVVGFLHFRITVQPLARNAANTAWIVPSNSAALTLEDDIDIATVGKIGEWSVNKLFELSGDANKFMMAEALRFVFDSTTDSGNNSGTFVGEILLR